VKRLTGRRRGSAGAPEYFCHAAKKEGNPAEPGSLPQTSRALAILVLLACTFVLLVMAGALLLLLLAGLRLVLLRFLLLCALVLVVRHFQESFVWLCPPVPSLTGRHAQRSEETRQGLFDGSALHKRHARRIGRQNLRGAKAHVMGAA